MIRRIAPVLWLLAAAVLIGACIGLSARANAQSLNDDLIYVQWLLNHAAGWPMPGEHPPGTNPLDVFTGSTR